MHVPHIRLRRPSAAKDGTYACPVGPSSFDPVVALHEGSRRRQGSVSASHCRRLREKSHHATSTSLSSSSSGSSSSPKTCQPCRGRRARRTGVYRSRPARCASEAAMWSRIAPASALLGGERRAQVSCCSSQARTARRPGRGTGRARRPGGGRTAPARRCRSARAAPEPRTLRGRASRRPPRAARASSGAAALDRLGQLLDVGKVSRSRVGRV